MKTLQGWIQNLLGAIVFYTCVPIPTRCNPKFQYVARLAPVVGALLGVLLAIINSIFATIYDAGVVRPGVIVLLWLGLTGGLHMDGAMDTADGLAVMDPKRRLQVMADSQSGAFGVMVAIAILMLKVLAMIDLMAQSLVHQNVMLVLAATWGRWAQQWAIARYPYLKPTGKGAFHKTALPSVRWCVPGFLLLLLGHGWWSALTTLSFLQSGLIAGVAIGTAGLTAAWFAHLLNGHTGDTYGAVVEWTEAIVLAMSSVIMASFS